MMVVEQTLARCHHHISLTSALLLQLLAGSMGLLFHCDFENGSCDMTAWRADHLKWSVSNQSSVKILLAASSVNGYLYAKIQLPGDNVLYSAMTPQLIHQGHACVRFAFYGYIQIHLLTNDSGSSMISATPGDKQWNRTNIDVSLSTSNSSVVFIADTNNSLVAIDEVVIEKGCCNTTQCEGTWSTWQPWSDCDAGCGLGYTHRMRLCQVSACPGDNREDRECQTHMDCMGKWMTWQTWSACDGGCKTGVKKRIRICEKPDPIATPCSGEDVGMSLCFQHTDCPAQWLSWGEWGACDIGCGQGQKNRTRPCDNPRSLFPCIGEHVQRTGCVFRVDCAGVWQTWDVWSECDGGCGRGHARRSRACNKPRPLSVCGIQSRYQQRQCTLDIDCVGNWGTWTAWTSCNISCGRGFKNRERSCVKPDSLSICIGSAVENRACTLTDCPVDTWGTWQDWTACNEGCGEGFKGRQRICASRRHVHPRCHGHGIQIVECNMMEDCPAIWQTWGDWSRCDDGCGIGRKYRERGCDTLIPNVNCTADWSDMTECSLQVDCAGVWNTWMEWGDCDEGCGIGRKSRERICIDRQGNSTCFGEHKDTRTCSMKIDCTDGWTTWDRWGECNGGCGAGFKFRSRHCRSSPGVDCKGEDQQLKVCSMKRDCPPCPDKCERCTRADDVIGCDVGYCQSGYERDEDSGGCFGSAKLVETSDLGVNQLYYLVVIPTLAVMVLALGYWLRNKKKNTVSVESPDATSDDKLHGDTNEETMTARDAESVAKFNEQEYKAYEMLVHKGRLSHPHERLLGIRGQLRLK